MIAFSTLTLVVSNSALCDDRQVSFDLQPQQLVIEVDSHPIAVYVFDDPEIPRPYFAHVKAPFGLQLTRHHPPIDGQDATDHPTMHPGIWLAFGDLDGTDFWRNKGRIVHRRFIGDPQDGAGAGSFTEVKEYLREDGSVICQEEFSCRIVETQAANILELDSVFSSTQDFCFGDQEEMGLGIRLATPLAEVNGGLLRDADGRSTAKEIWSQSAKWCDYSGVIDDQRVGMAILCHPNNDRPSWFHARDYGFVAANMFGRKAMHKGPASQLVVPAGEHFRLRYAIAIYSSKEQKLFDIQSIYNNYTLSTP